jgi:hypothetical protein
MWALWSPGWSERFLRAHVRDIAAIDMLTVPTLGFKRLYAVVVLGHERRRILHAGAAAHPTALWLASQIKAAFAHRQHPRILVRDNDRLYGCAFRDSVRALGLDDRPTQIASPWQNGHGQSG